MGTPRGSISIQVSFQTSVPCEAFRKWKGYGIVGFRVGFRAYDEDTLQMLLLNVDMGYVSNEN